MRTTHCADPQRFPSAAAATTYIEKKPEGWYRCFAILLSGDADTYQTEYGSFDYLFPQWK